jgi:beta-lactamase regulating signal transducer with metallopeptidase domain
MEAAFVRYVAPVLPLLFAATGRIAAFLATYAIHSTVLIGAALLLTSRRFPLRLAVSTRDVLWKTALVGGLVTAVAQYAAGLTPLGGKWSLDALRGASPAGIAIVVVDHREEAGAAGAHSPKNQIAVFTRLGLATAVSFGAAVLWLSGAVFASMRARRRRSQLAQLLASRQDASGTAVDCVLREVRRIAGVRRYIALSVTDALESPAALPGGEICLPRRVVCDVDLLQQESIIAHELAHIVRRDPAWLVATAWIETAFFFQPLNRIARGRMLEAAEFACDDWAARVTRAPIRLARALAMVATWMTMPTRAASVPAMIDETGSVFVRRVKRLTSGEDVTAPRRARSSAALVACSMLVAASFVAPRFETSRHSLGLNLDRRFTRRLVDAPVGGERVERTIVIDAALRDTADLLVPRRVLRLPAGDALMFPLAIPERDGIVILRSRVRATGT